MTGFVRTHRNKPRRKRKVRTIEQDGPPLLCRLPCWGRRNLRLPSCRRGLRRWCPPCGTWATISAILIIRRRRELHLLRCLLLWHQRLLLLWWVPGIRIIHSRPSLRAIDTLITRVDRLLGRCLVLNLLVRGRLVVQRLLLWYNLRLHISCRLLVQIRWRRRGWSHAIIP